MKKLVFILTILTGFILAACATAYALEPTPGNPKCQKEGCYWCTPMDITDEQSVWKMLCSPITVLDGDQKDQYLMREKPDKSSNAVAEITYASQGVHVLEKLDNGWTRVETRSSSFADSKVKQYNTLVTGYVETRLLKEVTPCNDNYAIVIDKMTQRLYVFRNGALYTTLLCSTGAGTKDKPYNETQSGEYLIVSPVGDFYSDNLVCEMGLRFNRGNLLHQVPYIVRNEEINWYTCESALGKKASHGCIRVQRKLTPENVNMTWLWNNRKMKAKLVIWEDIQGRTVYLPGHDDTVYVARSSSKVYHKCPECNGVDARYEPMTAIPYLSLTSSEYQKYTPCTYCVPYDRPETYISMNKASNASVPIYTDSFDGIYYHWNGYCTALPQEYLPLNVHTGISETDPLLSQLKPCTECVVKAMNPTLYYNPRGGKYYHSVPDCAYVNKIYLPLTPFEYRELDTKPYSSLSPCNHCTPVARGVYPTDVNP